MDILTLLAGLVAAVYGAQFLVDGGSAIARRYNIPTIVIGSTIVAFGTSMPEFTVNINSAINGNADLALGNILGSNLFNIAAIVGIVCLLAPIKVGEDSVAKDLPMCLIAAMVVGIAGNELFFDKINYHQIFASDGLIFLFFLAIFMRYVYAEASASAAHHQNVAQTSGMSGEGADAAPHAMGKSVLYVIIGLVGLVAGGEFIVDGATGIARSLGLEERVIGLVIVGPGTSFPELIASIAAARRKDVGMVMGNVLGSNIINVFFTLGVTALIIPIPMDLALNTIVMVNIGVTALILAVVLMRKDRTLGRGMGALLLLIYLAYIVYSLVS
jgi:cation:H+ antiporter